MRYFTGGSEATDFVYVRAPTYEKALTRFLTVFASYRGGRPVEEFMEQSGFLEGYRLKEISKEEFMEARLKMDREAKYPTKNYFEVWE